jgi:post-segregation antitoxin (ccd killing protein)
MKTNTCITIDVELMQKLKDKKVNLSKIVSELLATWLDEQN